MRYTKQLAIRVTNKHKHELKMIAASHDKSITGLIRAIADGELVVKVKS